MKYPFDHGDMPDDETLEQVGQFLKSWQAPEADSTAKARLIARLMQTRSITPVPVRPPLKMSLRWTWLILRAQMRLINRVTWTASALVLALGTIVTLLSFQTPNGTTLPIILVAPVVAARLAGAAATRERVFARHFLGLVFGAFARAPPLFRAFPGVLFGDGLFTAARLLALAAVELVLEIILLVARLAFELAARAARIVLLHAAVGDHPEIMVRELQIIFRLHPVAVERAVMGQLLVLFQQLRSIAASAAVDPVKLAAATTKNLFHTVLTSPTSSPMVGANIPPSRGGQGQLGTGNYAN